MCSDCKSSTSVSLKRINNFLSLDEVDETLVYKNITDARNGMPLEYIDSNYQVETYSGYNVNDTPIIIKDGSFAWGSGDNVLRDINVKVYLLLLSAYGCRSRRDLWWLWLVVLEVVRPPLSLL